MREYAFTILFSLTDGPALIAAARARVIESGIAGDMAAATDIIADTDYAHAARMLLDPGEPLPGIEILDTGCESTFVSNLVS